LRREKEKKILTSSWTWIEERKGKVRKKEED